MPSDNIQIGVRNREEGDSVKNWDGHWGCGTVKKTVRAIGRYKHKRTTVAVPSFRVAHRARFCGTARWSIHNTGTTMERGHIKFFDTDRGFAFIEPQSGDDDVFLHVSNITGATRGEDLREGQEMAFEVEETEKGLSALNASPVG